MPYIKQEERDRFKNLTEAMLCDEIGSAGNLNYLITKLCQKYLSEEKGPHGMVKLSYERFNSVIGALESSKLELYRRQIAPYEDVKVRENGDV